jgi:hypothetical protein
MLKKKYLILFTVMFATIALLGISQVQAQSTPSTCQEAVLFGGGTILVRFDPATPNCQFVGAYGCESPGDLSTCTEPIEFTQAYCCEGAPDSTTDPPYANCSPCNFGSSDTGCYLVNANYYLTGGSGGCIPCSVLPISGCCN